MATREFNFTVGPETSTQPQVGTPSADDDLITRSYADGRYLLGSQSVNKLGDAGYTVTDSDGYDVILVGQSANMTANRTVTLPTAADNDERRIRIGKADATAFTVTVDGEGSEVVGPNGATTRTLSRPDENIHLVCDGTRWHEVGRSLSDYAPIEISRKKNIGDAAYTITDVDGFDFVYSGTTLTAGRTVTLPLAANNDGRKITVKKADSGAFTLTLDGNGSEKIDGLSSLVLPLRYDSVTVECDGSAWHITDRKEYTPWTAYTPTVDQLGSGPTLNMYYMRQGNTLWVRGEITTGTGVGGTEVQIGTPSGVAIVTNASTNSIYAGHVIRVNSGITSVYHLLQTGTDTFFNIGYTTPSGSNASTPIAGTTFIGDSTRFTLISGPIEISEWTDTA